MWLSKQIPTPYTLPVSQICYFSEFFAGIQYLNAGYDVIVWYRAVEDRICFDKARELLTGHDSKESKAAIEYILRNDETEGRPPDLIVFDPHTNCFRFVECKREKETFSQTQPTCFGLVETLLNRVFPKQEKLLCNPSRLDLFPMLDPGQWIHIARIASYPG